MRRTPMCLAIHRACAPQSCEESQIITPILHVKTDTQEVHMVGTGDMHSVRVYLAPKFGLLTSGLGVPPTKNLAFKHWVAGCARLS